MAVPHPDPARARIIDASLNRAAEGLRAVEDICRFAWDLPGLSRELKELRHAVLGAFAAGPTARAALAASRDIEEDVGRDAPSPGGPSDLFDGAVRNLQRAKEALRTLEEVARVDERSPGATVSGLRYRLYSIEKAVLRLGARPERPMARVRLYLIASRAVVRGTTIEEAVEAALAGGADAVQLREKEAGDRERLALGRRLWEIAARAGAPFIVNDRPDLAVLLGADGVHIGQGDLPPAAARRILGPGGSLGVSTRDVEEARRAVREGADCIGIGPVFPTTTKDAGPAIGAERARAIAEAVDVPAFPIGGIGPETVEALAAAGLGRAAVSSGILGAGSARAIREAARRIADALGRVDLLPGRGAP
jgi:thiamine-phosphate pyrophosphorylase